MHPENRTSYPEIPREREEDIYNLHIMDSADLVIFMAGNQFMLMPELVSEFRAEYPEVQNIAYETLPPGLELEQILAGGFRFRGELFRIVPDVYTSVSKQAMELLVRKGLVDPEGYSIYLHNKLALMVKKGNPRSIGSVTDLGREDVIVSQPNPEYEHIAEYTSRMFEKAGGKELVNAVLKEKKSRGGTVLTKVHHRETPKRLIQGEADVGPVWYTEVIEAQRKGLEVEGVQVDPQVDQSEAINYYIASLLNCPNRKNSRKFLDFVHSPRARKVFERYGFICP